MADILVDTRNVEQFRRELSRFSESLRDLKELHRAAAEPVWAEQKAMAPVETGRLMGGIKISATKTGAKTYVRKSKTLPYANIQEFGGNVGWQSKGGRKWQMKGGHVGYKHGAATRVPLHAGGFRTMSHALIPVKPRRESGYFFYPGFRKRINTAVDVYARGIEKLLNKYFG